MNRKVKGLGKFLGLPFEPQPGRWLYLLLVDRIALRAWHLHDEMVLILLLAVKLLRVLLRRFLCFSSLGFSGSLRKGQPLWYEQFGHFTAVAAESLQSCPTLCDPIDGSPPGCPSLGFSKQEHWSGLPFPSPMHESEKWKWSHSVVPDPQWPMDCSLPGSSVHGIFQARVLEWGAIAFSVGHFRIFKYSN